MPEADLILLQRFAAHDDEDAFAEIVKRYAPMVYAAGLRVLGDTARAEDVTQETFFQLLRKPDAATQSLGGWLHRVATQRAIDILRSDTARRLREKLHGQRNIERQKIDTWSDLSPMIDEALAKIDPAERDLLVRHYLKGDAQSDIAADQDTSPATISRRMKRAVESLRQQLEKMGVTANLSIVLLVLERSVPMQLPAQLARELGKMSMLGGVVSAGGGLAALHAMMGGLLFAALIAAVAGAGWLMFDQTQPAAAPQPPAVAPPAPASPDTEAEQPPAAPQPEGPAYVMLPDAGRTFDTRVIVGFENPTHAAGGKLSVVFGDGHVERLTAGELDDRITAQTGVGTGEWARRADQP